MDNSSSDSSPLLPDKEEHKKESVQAPEEAPLSAAGSRQTFSAEARTNLNFSLRYNGILVIIAIGKIAASLVVLADIGSLCFGVREIWILCMLAYDIFYSLLLLLTIKNIIQMNQSVKRRSAWLSFNSDAHQRPSIASDHQETSGDEIDEIREYDVESSHRIHRIASLSRRTAKRQKTITSISKISDGVYFLIFVAGQILYFFFKGSPCDTVNTNRLMFIYLIMGYIWVLRPLLLLLGCCLCFRLFSCCTYVCRKGSQAFIYRVDISKLQVKTYSNHLPGNHECLICMLEYHEGDSVIYLDCNPTHNAHEECLKRWLKINSQCPSCRTNIGQMGSNSKQN